VVLLNKGVKLGEGQPKEMIDDFKRVLVGQYELPKETIGGLAQDEDVREAVNKQAAAQKLGLGKPQGTPNTLEYGTGDATIEEIYITDDGGVRTNSIIKGSEFGIHMRVRFNRDLPAPIFAFTIKNPKGTEITGTNTMFEKAFLEPVAAGEVKVVSFRQRMSLQGGEYLISFGVTGYEGDNFEVYHRLYDAIDVMVVSDKNTVGFYDMDSKIEIENG
jgi:teichoic acid transport system ATP-binding protein